LSEQVAFALAGVLAAAELHAPVVYTEVRLRTLIRYLDFGQSIPHSAFRIPH
jgi:hypothetical protein